MYKVATNEDLALVAGRHMSPSAKTRSNEVRGRHGLPLHEGAGDSSVDMSLEEINIAGAVPPSVSPYEQALNEAVNSNPGPIFDDSFLPSVKKGWKEEENWIGDAFSYAFAKNGPAAFKLITAKHSPSRYFMSDAFISVMENVIGDDKLYSKVQNMSEEDRRDFLRQEKQKIFDDSHMEVEGSPGYEAIGSMGRMALEPTSLIGGTSLKALVLAGGGVGGLNSVFEGLAEEGKADVTDVAIGVGVGMAGGLALKVIETTGKAGVNFLRDAWTNNRVITEKELVKHMRDNGNPSFVLTDKKDIDVSADAERLGTNFNKEDLVDLNYLLHGTEKPSIRITEDSKDKIQVVTPSKPIVRTTEGEKPRGRVVPGKPKVRVTEEGKTGKPRVKQVGTTKPKIRVTVDSNGEMRVRVTEEGKPVVRVTEEGKPSKPKVRVTGETETKLDVTSEGTDPIYEIIGETKPKVRVTGKTKPKGRVTSEGKEPITPQLPSTDKIEYVHFPIDVNHNDLKVSDIVDFSIDNMLAKRKVEAKLSGDTKTEDLVDALIADRARKPAKTPDVSLYKGNLNNADTELPNRVAKNEEASIGAEEVLTDSTGEMTESATRATGGITSLDEAVEHIEAGTIPIDAPMAKDLLPTFGIDINYSKGTPTWPALSRVVGHGLISSIYARPAAVLKSFGNAGTRLAERLAVRREKISQRIGAFDVEFMRTLNSTGYKNLDRAGKKAVGDMVKALARKSITPEQASPEAVKIYKFLDSHFKRILSEAGNTRVISGKRMSELRQNYAQNGYWPRIINYTFLETKKGKKQFIDALTEHSFTPNEIERVRKSLTGKKWRKLQNISKLDDDGTYKIDRNVAEALLDVQKGKMNDIKSNHLEKNRTLDLPDEVLDPFLMDEIENVMISYNRDTIGKIMTNRVFGPNGEKAARDILDIRRETNSPDTAKMALQTYFNSIGDTRGKAIRELANISERAKKVQAFASSYQSLKLLTAQISNLTSIGVLLPIATSRLASSQLAGMAAARKGIAAAMTEEGWEVARRMGAVSDTLIIQMQSEMGSMEKRLTTRYLKGIGFTASEEFNRTVAAHTGLALIDDLYSQKSKIIAKQAAQRAGKSDLKRLEKIDKNLDELGLNRDRSLTTASDHERAAQRFSNTINFVAAGDQLPLTLQSPYARLFRQFQTYSLFYGAFLKDNVFVPLSQGNIAPLATLLLTSSTAGSAIYSIKEMAGKTIDAGFQEGVNVAKGDAISSYEIKAAVRDSYEAYLDKSLAEHLFAGTKMSGGVGIFGNYAEATTQSAPGQLLSTVAGPTASDIAKVSHGIGKAIMDLDPEPAVKAALRTLPRGKAVADAIYEDDAISSIYNSREKSSRLEQHLKNLNR